jgi:hypothetical protein
MIKHNSKIKYQQFKNGAGVLFFKKITIHFMKISFKVFFYSEWHIGKETFDARAQKEKNIFLCTAERNVIFSWCTRDLLVVILHVKVVIIIRWNYLARPKKCSM